MAEIIKKHVYCMCKCSEDVGACCFTFRFRFSLFAAYDSDPFSDELKRWRRRVPGDERPCLYYEVAVHFWGVIDDLPPTEFL